MDNFKKELMDIRQRTREKNITGHSHHLIMDVTDSITRKIGELHDRLNSLSSLTFKVFSSEPIEHNCNDCEFFHGGRPCDLGIDGEDCENFVPLNHVDYNFIEGKWYKR